MSTVTHENAIRGALRIAKAASNGIPSNHPRIAAAEGALTEILASHKALVSALKDAQKSCNDMRSEHRLHGHITDASAHWAIVVEPRIMEALAQAEKVAK